MSNPYRQYQKTAVTTASREKILLMLYEGAIRFVRKGHKAMLEKQIAEKGRCMSKATAILSELMATLDFEAGGDLAVELERLYAFMIDKLIEGNIENNPECLTAVEEILNTLYVAWKDVIDNPRPDGEPSPRLQPGEHSEWKVTGKAPEPAKLSQKGQDESDAPKLKIMA